MKKHTYTLKDVENTLGNFKLIGCNFEFSNISKLEDADNNSLIWISPAKDDYQSIIDKTAAKAIICSTKIEKSISVPQDKSIILVENPRLVFLRICKDLYSPKIENGIHKSSILHPNAKISNNVHIGPNCYIGDCIILDGSYIIGNCYIADKVQIGRNVIIGANCTIGLDGFGYQKNENNEWEKFPHLGGVIIEDNVEIGSNTCIDRGTLGNTLIRTGAKIDNLVHIAHNVEIGQDSMIIANSMIGGSTIIEKNVWVAPSVSIRDGIYVGKDAFIGLGAVVTKNIPENQIWIGNPAKELTKK
jgi:UDP-3-O-[3-hydroxymyristoyl] glucosamine N-acyltransferase